MIREICKSCGGSGRVRVLRWFTKPCGNCNGCGDVQAFEPIRLFPSSDHHLVIKDCHFSPPLTEVNGIRVLPELYQAAAAVDDSGQSMDTGAPCPDTFNQDT